MRVIVMRGVTKVSAYYCGLTHGYSGVGAMVLSIVLLLGTMRTCAHKRHLNQFEMLCPARIRGRACTEKTSVLRPAPYSL